MPGNAEKTLEPLRAGLVPVPAVPQDGVCEVCHSASDPTYQQCYQCFEAAQTTGAWPILPIAMSVHSGLLHRHLRGYKDDLDPEVRRAMSRRLAALAAMFLRTHARCLGDFDSVAVVPSVRRVALEPVVRQVQVLAASAVPTLDARPVGGRSLDVDRFVVTRDVRGERTLVLDDTFTSGASVFSACAALRDAGAQVIGPLILGRHIRPDRELSKPLVDWLEQRPWTETRCCRCAGERSDEGSML